MWVSTVTLHSNPAMTKNLPGTSTSTFEIFQVNTNGTAQQCKWPMDTVSGTQQVCQFYPQLLSHCYCFKTAHTSLTKHGYAT